MNIFNRFVVVLVALILLLAGVLVVLIMTGAVEPEDIPRDILLTEFNDIANSTGGELAVSIGIAAGLILAGLVLLTIELMPVLFNSDGMVLISSGESGVVRIARSSVRELSERTARRNQSVQRARCGVSETPEGLRIRCAVHLDVGSDVPGITSEIQHSINDVVEQSIGLPVANVAVRAKYSSDRVRSRVR